jgi:hypothetical protein
MKIRKKSKVTWTGPLAYKVEVGLDELKFGFVIHYVSECQRKRGQVELGDLRYWNEAREAFEKQYANK